MSTEIIISLFAIAITILGSLMWIIFNTGRIYQRIANLEHRITNLEDKVDGVSEKVEKLSFAIKAIVTYLATKDKDIRTSLFGSFSPFVLLKLGKEVLEVTGGKKYADENMEYLISKMEEEKEQGRFQSPLDVENFASSIIMDEIYSDDFVPIKNYLYQNPKYIIK